MAEVKYKDCRVFIYTDESAGYADDYGRKVGRQELRRDELMLDTVERLRNWVDRNEQLLERDDLGLLGRYLYQLLFDNEIGECFATSYDVFQNERENDESLRLRLWLIFYRDARELSAYPWEFIFMPRSTEEGFFLAAREELVLTRFVPELPEFKKLEPEDGKLRILVAYCHPKELDQIEADDVIQTISALNGNDIEVEQPLENCTIDELREAIRTHRPHVFHFIGHGDEGKIALVKTTEQMHEDEIVRGDTSEAFWCDVETVKSFFGDHRPRLAFLHACKTAAGYAESLRSFTNTARELVYSRIPAVIGMQFKIESRDAADFADAFYREIASGARLDEAVAVGRRKLGEDPRRLAWADRRFGTPLVYLQSWKPVVLSRPIVPESDQEAERPLIVPCPWGSGCTQLVSTAFQLCPTCRNPLAKCPNGHPVAAKPGKCAVCKADVSMPDLDDAATSGADATGASSQPTPPETDAHVG